MIPCNHHGQTNVRFMFPVKKKIFYPVNSILNFNLFLNNVRQAMVITFSMIALGDGGYHGLGNVMGHQLVKLYHLQACPRMCLLVEDVKFSKCVQGDTP